MFDQDLDQRIGINRVAFADISNMNMDLRSKLIEREKQVKKAREGDLNSLSHFNANLKAEKSELESRLNITRKDINRLSNDVANRVPSKIQYTVPSHEVH